MKDRDSQTNTHWSEADVESLLTEFFRAEMPAELRRPPRSRESRVQSPEPAVLSKPSRERRAAGYKGLGVAACALLLTVTTLSPIGKNLVSPNGDKAVANPDRTTVAVKDSPVTESNATGTAIAARKPLPTPPREILDMLPPELRSPAANAAHVFDGPGDGLDLRDLLEIEVFEPRDNSKSRKRRIPERRRLPEER